MFPLAQSLGLCWGLWVLSPLGPFIYLFSRPWVLASLALGKLRAGGPHSLDCLHKERLFGIDSTHSWNLPRPGRLPQAPWLFYFLATGKVFARGRTRLLGDEILVKEGDRGRCGHALAPFVSPPPPLQGTFGLGLRPSYARVLLGLGSFVLKWAPIFIRSTLKFPLLYPRGCPSFSQGILYPVQARVRPAVFPQPLTYVGEKVTRPIAGSVPLYRGTS